MSKSDMMVGMNVKKSTSFGVLAKFALLGVLLLILLRSGVYYNYLLGREVYFYSDDAIYATLSKRFLSGDFWHAFHPYWSPGFPLATLPFYLISKSWETAQFLVSAFSVTVLIFVLFWFYKRYSLFLAFIVAFVAAFSFSLQQLVVNGGMTEPFYIVVLWLGIFFSWLALTTSRMRFFMLSGVFFGLAYLTRTEAIAIFAFFIAIAFLRTLFAKEDLKKKCISLVTRVGIVIFFFLLVNLPYIAFQSQQLGRLTLSGKYAFFATGPYYDLEEDRMTTLAQDIWSTDYMDYSSPYFNPQRATDLMIKFAMNGTMKEYTKKSFSESIFLYRSVNNSNFFVGIGLYMALAGFILGILIKKFRMLTFYLFFLWIDGLVWISLFMGAHYRYLVYALPFFFYLQALTIYFVGRIFVLIAKVFSEQRLFSRVATGAAIILPCFLLTGFFIQNMSISYFTTIQHMGGKKDHKELGEWIKSQNIEVLGGRLEAIAFYANAKLVYMPSSPPKDIVSYMKSWGVEYLLVRPPEVGYDFVAPIADSKFKHRDLTLFKKFDDGSLIWRIKLTSEEKKNNRRLEREKKLVYDFP